MPTGHQCEIAALRLHWAARLLGSDDGQSKPQIEGRAWENVVHAIGRSTTPRVFQGRGQWKLFGSYGASGLNVEFDMALDYGEANRLVLLVEAKAHADRCLSRDHALVFAGKIRDHVNASSWAWPHAHMLVASLGRVEPSFCHWCFYEGIDVTDPDRVPLCVLVRLPALFPQEYARLVEPNDYQRLLQILCSENEDPDMSPILLRWKGVPKRLFGKDLLREIATIQLQLSEDFLSALHARFPAQDEDVQQAMLLANIRRGLAAKGIHLPALIAPQQLRT